MLPHMHLKMNFNLNVLVFYCKVSVKVAVLSQQCRKYVNKCFVPL